MVDLHCTLPTLSDTGGQFGQHDKLTKLATRGPKYNALRRACGLKVHCSPVVFLTTSTSQALREVLYLGP